MEFLFKALGTDHLSPGLEKQFGDGHSATRDPESVLWAVLQSCCSQMLRSISAIYTHFGKGLYIAFDEDKRRAGHFFPQGWKSKLGTNCCFLLVAY